MEFIGFVILVLGLIGAALLRRHLREAKLLKLRQIVHEERIKAMEHSLPLPDANDGELAAELARLSTAANTGNGRALKAAVLWVRIVALFVGLAGLFGGIGSSIGMFMIKDPEFSDYWSFGLIPVFIGLGLLIFFGLSRSLGARVAETAEE